MLMTLKFRQCLTAALQTTFNFPLLKTNHSILTPPAIDLNDGNKFIRHNLFKIVRLFQFKKGASAPSSIHLFLNKLLL